MAPLGWLYALIVYSRFVFVKPTAVKPVVLCVGNAVVGGSGKTPVCLALGRRAAERGIKVHYLTRGYGGKETGPVTVDPARHGAEDVGDEALLLAAIAPTWVSADRLSGAQQAAAAGAELIVMDDGLQNPSLQKSYSILTVDGSFGFGNGLPMPAGPMREFLGTALARVNRCVITGTAEQTVEDQLVRRKPVSRAVLAPLDLLKPYEHKPVVAFAGIGQPEKFFIMLKDAGLEVTESVGFADHHAYSESDISRLRDLASKHRAVLLTTMKDFVRLPIPFRSEVNAVAVKLVFRNDDDCDVILDEAMANG
ncbi:MAG: tetraacyldisaccharide 4'-kinase [Alphaproteobacteria bacterium]